MTTLKPTDLLKVNQLKTAPHARGDWHVTVDNDVPLERILTPGYWANHSRHIKAGDRIEVVREDFSLDVTLRAIRVVPGLVEVRMLYEPWVEDAEAATPDAPRFTADDLPEGYKLGHSPRGQHVGYFVQLKSTGALVGTGMKTEAGAIAFAVAHAQASATPARQAPNKKKGDPDQPDAGGGEPETNAQPQGSETESA